MTIIGVTAVLALVAAALYATDYLFVSGLVVGVALPIFGFDLMCRWDEYNATREEE